MASDPSWHEDEAFWETFRDYVFPPEKFEEGADQVEEVLGLVDLDPGAAVLDLPCGVGRHAVELADRGFEVTAVDATERYVEEARRHAREAGVSAEFVHGDMRSFRRQASFDAAVNLYTSFGYFEDRADDERAVRNVHASLKPGGVLVMSLTSKEVVAGKFEARTWTERDGAYVLEEHEVRDDWSWMDNRWVVVEDGDVAEFDVSHRLYSAYELRGVLERAGFDDVAVYGSLTGDDYDQDAERLVAVARK